MSRHRALGRRLAAAVVVTAGVFAAAGFSAGAGAAGEGGGSGDATADAFRVSVTAPGASLSDNVVDLGGPTAHARLDEAGGSEGFAAYPYPGDAALSAGLAAGATGVPLPPYPFAAAATYPATPEATVEYPGYRLGSRAGADEADATARSGAAGETAFGAVDATARVERRDGAVAAVATATSDLVHLGPLQVTGLRSQATATRASNGELRRGSEFTASLTVGGTALSVGDGGLMVAGSTVPVSGADPLLAALAQAGITLTYLHPEETDDGVISAGLVVRNVRRVEGVGTGVVVTALTFGRTAAAARRSTKPGGELGELPGAVPGGDLPGDEPVPGRAEASPLSLGPEARSSAALSVMPSATGTSAAGVASGPGGVVGLSGSGVATGTDSQGMGSPAAPGRSGPQQMAFPARQAVPAGLGAKPAPGRFRSLYPLLAAAGLATVIGQHGLRILVGRGLG